MKRDRIIEIVKQVAEAADLPAADESLFDAGILDSFKLTDVIESLESEFGIKVPDSDLTPRKFETIEKIEAYLDGHRN